MSGLPAGRARRCFAPMLGAALIFALPAPALAQDDALPAAAAVETVTIPFAPPLGKPVTYGLRFERKRPRGDSVIDFEQRLTFERLGEGFVLKLETLSFASGGQRFDLSDQRVLDAAPPALRIYILPMTVELDGAGEMVRMRDWEAMRAQLRQLPEAAAAMSGEPVNEAALAAVKSVLDPIINSSAEDAPAFMIRGWPAVLGYGGAEFDLGETLEVATLVTGGILPEPIPATAQGSLTRTSEGHLLYTATTRFDPADMRAAIVTVLERMKAQMDRTGRPGPAEEIRSLDITDDMTILFDPVTGLPVTARIARITSVATTAEAQTGGEITTIRRIAP